MLHFGESQRTGAARSVRAHGRILLDHLADHPDYRHYPVYAVLLYTLWRVLMHWPYSFDIWIYLEYLHEFQMLEAAWTVLGWTVVLLATVGLFGRGWARKLTAAAALYAVSLDTDLLYWMRVPEDVIFFTAGDPMWPVTWTIICVGSALAPAYVLAEHRPGLGALLVALQLAITYAVARRWVWPTIRRRIARAAQWIESTSDDVRHRLGAWLLDVTHSPNLRTISCHPTNARTSCPCPDPPAKSTTTNRPSGAGS